MSSRRAQKAAQAVREVVSMAILAELKDPRIRDVTVTYVEMSADLRHAKVHVSVMGDQTRQELSLRGLKSAAGFLQSRLARRLETRYTPRLDFILDQGVKHSIEVARILREVLPPDSEPDQTAAEAQTEPDEAAEAQTEPDDAAEDPSVPRRPASEADRETADQHGPPS
jgi:ribosome-binding factor A